MKHKSLTVDNGSIYSGFILLRIPSKQYSSDDLLRQLDKIAEYFEAGVKQVWVVYPRQKVVQIYDSLNAMRAVAETGILESGAILPGFQLPLRDLFVFATLDEPTEDDE